MIKSCFENVCLGYNTINLICATLDIIAIKNNCYCIHKMTDQILQHVVVYGMLLLGQQKMGVNHILISDILHLISLEFQLSVHLLVRMVVSVTTREHVCVCLDSQERPANNVSLIKPYYIS